MATDRYPVWAAEYAGTSSGPTVAQVLSLFASLFAAVALILGLVLGMAPATDRGGQPTRPTTPPPCATVFPPTCEGVPRGR
jgi:hypothetical protein